jgi:hypothetical protein
MANTPNLPLEERRKGLLEIGWEYLLPTILIAGEKIRGDHKFAHVCNEIRRNDGRYPYGGYLVEGKCQECGFVADENTQFVLKLLEFKG